MAVELVSADFPVKYEAGKLKTEIAGVQRSRYGWIVSGVTLTFLALAFLPKAYALPAVAIVWAWGYYRRNSTVTEWQQIPRDHIAEVKVLADESRVKVGSRIAFGILATQSRETLVSVILKDGRKALFKTDRSGLPQVLALGH